jgi:hypothetical protein
VWRRMELSGIALSGWQIVPDGWAAGPALVTSVTLTR